MNDLFGDEIREIINEDTEKTKTNIFDYIKDVINYKTDKYYDIIKENESSYVFSVINKYISLVSAVTALYANEMNMRFSMHAYMQYEYYINVLPKTNNTFIKYIKHDTSEYEQLNAIKKYYNCNNSVAKSYIKLLTKEELDYIISIYNNK